MEGDFSAKYAASTSPRFLSTPSGWRATIGIPTVYTRGVISIHALRVEGDLIRSAIYSPLRISIHALRVEGDLSAANEADSKAISIHALRVEGDGLRFSVLQCEIKISIHALRVEGDRCPKAPAHPHAAFLSTPSGWRATTQQSRKTNCSSVFLSTPSGWRATRLRLMTQLREDGFLSTPSGWRATYFEAVRRRKTVISIHALRVEGDYDTGLPRGCPPEFLSTPSGWRATAG